MRPETKRLLASQRATALVMGCLVIAVLIMLFLPNRVGFFLMWWLFGICVFAVFLFVRDAKKYYRDQDEQWKNSSRM